MAVPMTLVYQCTVSVIIPGYTVFGRILVTLTLALNKAKARNTRPRPRPRPKASRPKVSGQKIWPRGQGLTTLADTHADTHTQTDRDRHRVTDMQQVAAIVIKPSSSSAANHRTARQQPWANRTHTGLATLRFCLLGV